MPQVTQLRGAALLRVVSIILIIIGAIATASGAISLTSGQMMAQMFGLDAIALQYFWMIGVISLITGVASLVFGALGLRFRNRQERANVLALFGIIQAVLTVFSVLYSNAMAPIGARVLGQIMETSAQSYGIMPSNMNMEGLLGNAPMTIGSFALAGLYIIGALLNRLPPKGQGLHVHIHSHAESGGVSHTDGGVSHTDGGASHTDGGVSHTDEGVSHTDGGASQTEGEDSQTAGEDSSADDGAAQTDDAV